MGGGGLAGLSQRSSNSSSRGRQKQAGGRGTSKLGDGVEAWDGGVPSQSSVVSQLTSRGTWRHLVPVWMTVTVEGRGRDGSATSAGSSRAAGGASGSWVYTLTAEGRGSIGGPEGGNKRQR